MEQSMKVLLTGECCISNIFSIVDPTSFSESAFEAEVVKALTCFYPNYFCGIFAGAFLLEGDRRKSDLALIHKDFSHWFVLEVELAWHSLQQHVLPQSRCFRYGDPDDTCISSLVNAFQNISQENAKTILYHIPRYAAVISNIQDLEWKTALDGLDVQHLVVSVYRNNVGKTVHELEGQLTARTNSLGFARYSAIDKCMRIKAGCGLPVGSIQIVDQFGNPGIWTVREEKGKLWIYKDNGPTTLTQSNFWIE
jgi:hypothetical protein